MRFIFAIATVLGMTSAYAVPFPDSSVTPSTGTTVTYKRIDFSIAPGKVSAPIGIPAKNLPVHMMVAVTTHGDLGVGEATIMRNDPAAYLEWVGIDLFTNRGGNPTVSAGDTNEAGDHIIWADNFGHVEVLVASATQIKIRNTNTVTEAGHITFMW